MRYLSLSPSKSIIPIIFLLMVATGAEAQKIDMSRDTVSRSDARGGRDSYLNAIRGSGQKATERINLSVSKLKEIVDACATKGITEISALIIVIRQNDVARYRRNHPETTATDAEIRGSQLIVFRVPRRAFAGASGAKVNLSTHPLMMSLAAAGLVAINAKYTDLGFDSSDDMFFDFGTICPPPASCD